jgi:hypothetical protein
MDDMKSLLGNLCPLAPVEESICSNNPSDDTHWAPSICKTPRQWADTLQAARKAYLELLKGHGTQSGEASESAQAAHLDLAWVNQAAIVPAPVDGTASDATSPSGNKKKCLDSATAAWNAEDMFSLNKEQKRAFRLLVQSVSTSDTPQLCLYLAGMAGTGKSRVFKAIILCFECIGEPGAYIVLAPTGSAAALVGGSTYHLVLGLSKSTVIKTIFGRAKIYDRLKTKCPILIDECSMLSSLNLFMICFQLSCMLGNWTQPFAGHHVVLAGDFAQLPPVTGRNVMRLYSTKPIFSQGHSKSQQQNAIGCAIWHYFTAVVILRQNMRQRGLPKKTPHFAMPWKI